MKTVFALLALVFSTAAFSECYSIYSASNELVWEGMSPPVPMDTVSLDEEVNKIVPKGHMVVTNIISSPCPPVNLIKPRQSMREKVEETKYN